MSTPRSALVSSWMILAAASCQPERSTEPAADTQAQGPGNDFAAPIERAHSAEAWRQKEGFESGIVVSFGGNTILDGRMLMTPSMSRTRVELSSGPVVIWDGTDAWVSPSGAEFPEARFHALTWSYFLSVPTKLRDPGARVSPLGEKELRGQEFDAAKLTFDPGVGDTPDDWYVLYRNPENGRLAAMAYIVTFGTSREEAEKEPHAITYDEYVEIDGVAIPTKWTFWTWSEGEGIHGEPIGGVTLTDPRFVTPDAAAFELPEDRRKEELPSPTGG